MSLENSVKELLMIFVKNPEKGRVKTRLAKSIGDEQALNVYGRLLELTRATADKLDCDRQVWYSRAIERGDRWPEEKYLKRLQQGEDLGERMKFAFREAFREGYKKVVIIGSDCADLREEHLRRAFAGLRETEVVIGPAKDGGYYLLGLTLVIDGLFENKRWSTPAVLEQTVKQLRARGIAHKLLNVLNDIDTAEDLENANLNFTDL